MPTAIWILNWTDGLETEKKEAQSKGFVFFLSFPEAGSQEILLTLTMNTNEKMANSWAIWFFKEINSVTKSPAAGTDTGSMFSSRF